MIRCKLQHFTSSLPSDVIPAVKKPRAHIAINHACIVYMFCWACSVSLGGVIWRDATNCLMFL